MKTSAFSMKEGQNLYVRIPENDSKELMEMILYLHKESAGKTLRITVMDNSSAPFEMDAIKQESGSNVLDYFGEDSYWEPKDQEHVLVEDHPECEYADCTADCHVVSCPVHQGFSPCKPMKIEYLSSDKVK